MAERGEKERKRRTFYEEEKEQEEGEKEEEKIYFLGFFSCLRYCGPMAEMMVHVRGTTQVGNCPAQLCVRAHMSCLCVKTGLCVCKSGCACVDLDEFNKCI